MAKVPRPGSVMTRLAPLLGHDGCARLQGSLLWRAAQVASAAAPGAAFLAVAPPGGRSDVEDLVPAGIRIVPQVGTHLGERMASAAGAAFDAGHAPVVVIGTDVPLLVPGTLRQALATLASGADVVFGPAVDGGYYLVGLRAFGPEVFALDPALWGGPGVLDASLAASGALGLRAATLEPLRDLDTPEDAAALVRDPGLPSGIGQALAAALDRRRPPSTT